MMEMYRIEHAGRHLRHARGRIARPGNIGDALGHDGSKLREVNKLRVFHAGAEGSRRGHHRVPKGHARDGHRHVRSL